MGSAGSGKSYNIALDYILKLSQRKYQGANLLVVRKTETSHLFSTFAQLQEAINKLNQQKIWNITKNPLSMTCTITGNQIIFRGFKDANEREKVKSVTFPNGKLTWIWIEEATELQEADVDILDDRLRGSFSSRYELYYQITLSFNPVSATHWIKKKYWDYESKNIFKHHSTYLENAFIDEGYKERMMMRKEQDPEGYRIYGLGEWGNTEGLVLKNYIITDISTDFSDYNSVHYAQDFGFNHANCILEVGFKDDNIYILRELYVHEKDTNEIIELANKMDIKKKKIMYCDSAEPDRIQMWRKAGYNAVPVSKEPNSVHAQIDYLKQHKIFINGSCINTAKEIQQWRWKQDKVSGQYLDEAVDIFDDAMACLRYCIEPYRKPEKKLKASSKARLGL